MDNAFKNSPIAGKVLDCASPKRKRSLSDQAFTLTELLVVIAILALLAVTQLPALTGSKAPVNFTQCINNLRKIGQATSVYTVDNNDCIPFNNLYISAWPDQLLRYLGNSTNQPKAYVCPQVKPEEYASGQLYQIHYQGNRCVLADYADLDQPLRRAQIKIPSVYWLLIEMNPYGEAITVRPGGLGSLLSVWNNPPTAQFPKGESYGKRRHNGGMCSVAVDGHTEWLRTPPYRVGQPPPTHFGELGDAYTPPNSGASWKHNGPPIKLYSRDVHRAAPQIQF